MTQPRQKGRRLHNREGDRVQIHELFARVHVDADFPVTGPDARGRGPEVAVLPAPFAHVVPAPLFGPLVHAIAPPLGLEAVVVPNIDQSNQGLNRVTSLENRVWPGAGIEPVGAGTTRHRAVTGLPFLTVGVASRVARHRELDCFQGRKINLGVSSHRKPELPIAGLGARQRGPEVTTVPAPDRVHVDFVTRPLPHVDVVAIRRHLVGVVGLDVRQVDQAGNRVTLFERRRRIVAGVDPVCVRAARNRTLASQTVWLEVVRDVRLHEHIRVVPVVVDTPSVRVSTVVPATVAGKVLAVLAVLTLVDTEVAVWSPATVVGLVSDVADRHAFADGLTNFDLQCAGEHVTHDRRHTLGTSPTLQNDSAAVAVLALGQLDHTRARRLHSRANDSRARHAVCTEVGGGLEASTPVLVAVGLPVVERPLKCGRLARPTDGEGHLCGQAEECENHFTTHGLLLLVLWLYEHKQNCKCVPSL